MAIDKLVLINGRFELLNGPARLEIFDIKNLKRDQDGHPNSVAVLQLDAAVSDLDAGKRALSWLRDTKYIDQTDFFRFLEIFLAGQPADQAATDKELARNKKGRIS